MSESALTKVQKDCEQLEAEIQILTNSKPMSTSCDEMVAFISSQNDPFYITSRNDPNAWNSNGQSNKCKCIVS